MSSLFAFAWRRNRGSPKNKNSAENAHVQQQQQQQPQDRDDTSVTSYTSDSSPRQLIEQHDHLYNHHRIFHPNASPVPAAIQASQSSDTVFTLDSKAAAANHYSSASSSFAATTNIQVKDDVLCLSRRRGVMVVTPTGLKTRASFTDLQAELGLDPTDLMMMPSLPSMSSEEEEGDFNQHESSKDGTALVPVQTSGPNEANNNAPCWKVYDAVLPEHRGDHFMSPFSHRSYPHQQLRSTSSGLPPGVLPPPPSRSWSTDNVTSTTQGSPCWASPTPASHPSSRGTHGAFSWQTTPSAESPNLVPGHARTAVGNLVAMAQQQDPPGQRQPHADSLMFRYSPMMSSKKKESTSLVLTTSSPTPVKQQALVRQATREPTGALTRAASSTAIGRDMTKVTTTTPNKLSYDDDWVYSPQEDTVDCMFSPMTSRAAGEESAVKQQQQQQQQHDGRGTEQVILSEKNHNLSIHSNKAMLVAAAATSSDAASAHALDGDIRRMKKRNQQRAKEDLIIAALERLQDDTQLVADVQNLLGIRSSGGGGGAGNDNSMFDWFVGTPLDEEGLLTGFSEEKRMSILEKIDLVLQELNTVVHPAEFVLSPSGADNIRSEYRREDNHVELREALQFCKVLVRMAIPQEEKDDASLQGTNDVGRWQFLPGLREAIGVQTVVTPEARQNNNRSGAGDSSFFTLPSDDRADAETPMTSNVSLGNSTLTTYYNSVSPTAKRSNKASSGLDLRQAIQEFATGLQKLSQECRALCEMGAGQSSLNGIELVRVTEQIKKTYFERLMEMKQHDLKSLVDAFEFELDNSYEYEDDTDEDDDNEENVATNYPIVHAHTIGSGSLGNFSPLNTSSTSTRDANTSLCSLYTTATPSIVEEDENLDDDDDDERDSLECDDLRRQKGSSDDRDNIAEEREGAPRDDDFPNIVQHSGEYWVRFEL